ncbi:UNVERIFIED_CONTAM: hypothetical protein GTU68_031011 [Idotea baltica]|nr:hypothetical protein [Idotea baltica]
MLSQSQHLKLKALISPQQIQFIKLLQIPTATLEARIKEELETNPALEDENTSLDSSTEVANEYADLDNDPNEKEKEDDFNLNDYLQDEYSYREKSNNYSDEDDDYKAPIVSTQSALEQLEEQLAMVDLTEEEEVIAHHLVGSIDEDGYIRRPIPAIVNDMAFRYNMRKTPEEVEEVLFKIQQFDPAGIAARDLRECLMLQLERRLATEVTRHAFTIVDKYFEEFTKKHFKKLKSALSIDDEMLKEAYNEITKLNPKPGGSKAVNKLEFIIPDFLMHIENNEIDIKLNRRNAPELNVSGSYLKMFKEYKAAQKKEKKTSTKETLDFVKNKIESAQWFIDALKQRSVTLLNTMIAIADRQRDFFLSAGDERKLRPMILKDIAEVIEMDISTISRVANSKYVQTDWGIYSLKYFFTEGITTESGEEVSNREVKSILEELVNNESKKKPLSDDKLSELLKERGYAIARRTVAKYREQLNIPVARLRKEV